MKLNAVPVLNYLRIAEISIQQPTAHTSNVINIRNKHTLWRQFTKTQITTIKLQLESDVFVCNIPAYSARTPEQTMG